MKIGEKIAELRIAAGMSQEELAEHIDVSRQSVSKWEMDQALPQIDKVLQLCELFGISTDELLTDRGIEPVVSNTAAPQPDPSKKTTKIIFLILCLICIEVVAINTVALV